LVTGIQRQDQGFQGRVADQGTRRLCQMIMYYI
jgi:hypothetical protein